MTAIKEIPEVAALDAKINTLVHGELYNQHYKEIQHKFWDAIDAIQKRLSAAIPPDVEQISLQDALNFAEFMWANVAGPCCTNGYYSNHAGEMLTVRGFWNRFQPFRKAGQSAVQDATPQDFADLYKELAILEKQSRERYQKMIQDLEAALQYGRDSINEMAKQISQQNDLIVSLEATIDQDQQTKEELRQQLIVFKDECNRLQGVAEHWQMKACYNDPDKSAWRTPKIDNL